MLANLFYRNSRLTALTILLIGVAGLGALASLGRQEDPAMAARFGTVVTYFPGASALRVETLVTEPIEAELMELEEVDDVESTSRTGLSVIQLQLQDRVKPEETDAIWSKIRDEVAEAQLPPGTTPPEVEYRTPVAVTLLAAFSWEAAGPAQLDIATRLAEELDNQLRNLDGTKETELFGEAEEEIRVSVDPLRLASHHLTAADVARALARADSKTPAGRLTDADTELLIEVAGELTSVERVRRVPVPRRDDGRILRVGDVAEVEKTVREPAQSLAFVDGRPAVVVAATMEPDRRVDRWAEAARARVDAFQREVPAGIRLETIFDQSVYTNARLGTLAINVGIASGIVVGVLFVMMGVRSALVVGSALPLTVGAVLALFGGIGMPLHQMSVTGLIIALGLLIDNAIVVVDEYATRRREGLLPGEAVASSVQHLFVPLLASTATTIIAFMPIVLAPGGVSEFVGPISVGVILSVASSFLLSMTVIPALAAYFLRDPEQEDPAKAHRFLRHGFSNARLTRAYAATLDVVLQRPWLGIGVSLLLPLAGFFASTTLVEQFFPPNDRNQFQVALSLPEHSSLEASTRAAMRARALVEAHPDVVESHWFVGEGAPRVYYNVFGAEAGVPSVANAFVTTTSADATQRLLAPLQRELTEALPQARVMVAPFEQGPPFEAPIEVRVVGPDLDVLQQLGDEIRASLARTHAVTFTHAPLSGGTPKLLVRADESEARLAGLSLVDIAEQLSGNLDGVAGGSVLEANQQIPVRVRVIDRSRAEVGRIASASMLPGDRSARAGEEMPGVPLSALSEIELVPEVAAIPRRNGERINTVQGFLEPFSLISTSLEEFRERLDASGFTPPPGYRLEFGGEDEQRGDALASMMAFALPLLVLMAGTVILSFNSFRMACIIGVVAVLSVGLALLGVWLFGHPMGFQAIIGTLGLVGLSINGGIVVLSALRADPEACAGDRARSREVVIGATRHILATTLTTIGGFLPLIYLGGRFWPPLATAIAGGVGGSAILSLYLVPSLFVLLQPRAGRSSAAEPAGIEALPSPGR